MTTIRRPYRLLEGPTVTRKGLAPRRIVLDEIPGDRFQVSAELVSDTDQCVQVQRTIYSLGDLREAIHEWRERRLSLSACS